MIMTMERRRLARTLLLAAVLCGCASQQHRTETVADDTSAEDAEDVSESGSARSVAERAGADDELADADRDRADRPSAVATQPAERRDGDANDADANDGGETADRTNTAVNERDRGGATLTPTDQSNDESDLEITRRIRETVVEDDSLSFTAKNVKIITVDGRVTLRGPVRSQEERAAIEKMALSVAGAGQVVNQLEIK
jgi:hyperosmotically inducible protein